LLADADDASPVTEGHTTMARAATESDGQQLAATGHVIFARAATYLSPHRKLAASSTLPCPP